ncbi:MAG: hypothetical protein ACRCXZ_00025 [Patescibacteria group bacterium]
MFNEINSFEKKMIIAICYLVFVIILANTNTFLFEKPTYNSYKFAQRDAYYDERKYKIIESIDKYLCDKSDIKNKEFVNCNVYFKSAIPLDSKEFIQFYINKEGKDKNDLDFDGFFGCDKTNSSLTLLQCSSSLFNYKPGSYELSLKVSDLYFGNVLKLRVLE